MRRRILAVGLRGLVAGMLTPRACGAMAVVALLASLTTPSQGQADPGPNSEIFTGLEATDNATSGYLGFGYAFGKGLYESGWRLRAVGSLGAYDYQGTTFGEGPTEVSDGQFTDTKRQPFTGNATGTGALPLPPAVRPLFDFRTWPPFACGYSRPDAS